MRQAFAGPLQPVAQQMLAKACALLLAEDAAELGWAEPAQGSHILQRDLALEMRRHMRDGRMRFAVPVRAIRDGRGFAALRREPDGARWPATRLARQLDQRGEALAELRAGHRLHQQVPDPDAQRPYRHGLGVAAGDHEHWQARVRAPGVRGTDQK